MEIRYCTERIHNEKKLIITLIIIASIVIFYIAGYFIYPLAIDVHDSEYREVRFGGEIVLKEYTFEPFNRLYFFYDMDPLTDFTKKTGIKGSTPHLKIINSDENKVVIKGNSDCLQELKIGITSNDNAIYLHDEKSYNALTISFSDDCYVPVHVDDHSYDYDEGMYAYFDQLEVVVYARVFSLLTDSKIILDYDAPKCEKMYIQFSSDGTEAIINNIDAGNLELYCDGSSKIDLSGNVRNLSKIMIMHDTHVNASKLSTRETDFSVSAYPFHMSYIKCGNRSKYRTFIMSLLFGF